MKCNVVVVLETFNSLSRDHIEEEHHNAKVLACKLSTPSLGITSLGITGAKGR